jgi:pimeloyl-ACP methyl ester carboxylesterase
MDLTGLLMLLVAGGALLWCIVTVHTALILSRPPRRGTGYAVARELASDPEAWGAAVRWPRAVRFHAWTHRTLDGLDLPVWDVRCERDDGPVVVLSHGWGESRITTLPRLCALLPLCSRVVLWDMPGHADAPGHCRLGSREPDELVRLVKAVTGSDGGNCASEPASIVLWGFSLGAGVSLAAAASMITERSRAGESTGTAHPRVAVIAEAPYVLPATPAQRVLMLRGLPWRLNLGPALSALGVVWGLGPWWGRAGGLFDRREHARRLGDVPVLVLAPEHDEVCPIEDARAIAEAAPFGRLAVVPGAMHTRVWTDAGPREAATREVHAFIESLGRHPPAHGTSELRVASGGGEVIEG